MKCLRVLGFRILDRAGIRYILRACYVAMVDRKSLRKIFSNGRVMFSNSRVMFSNKILLKFVDDPLIRVFEILFKQVEKFIEMNRYICTYWPGKFQSPRVNGTPVAGNQLPPDKKLPTVNFRASVALVITWYPFQFTLSLVSAPAPVFLYSP